MLWKAIASVLTLFSSASINTIHLWAWGGALGLQLDDTHFNFKMLTFVVQVGRQIMSTYIFYFVSKVQTGVNADIRYTGHF